MTMRPCAYPGCADLDGEPRLTDQAICEPSRRHYRRVLDWLLEDYVTLHRELGQITANNGDRVTMSREYGHPGEMISDLKRRIAGAMSDTHDALADHLGHTPPPEPNGHRESSCVAVAHRYLSAHFDDLCTFPGAEDAATELHELHGSMRAALGANRRHEHLPTPCPGCDLLTLTRAVTLDGAEQIECAACGTEIPEQYYTLYLRALVAEFAPETCDVSQ